MIWSEKAMRWLELIMYLVVLNLLWILGVLAGFGILGIFPATFALFNVFGDEELFESQSKILPIARRYVFYYTKFFFKSNGLALIYATLVTVLYIDWFIIQNHEVLQAFLTIPIILILVYIFEVLIFFVLVMIYGKGSFVDKLKLAITAPLLCSKASFFNLIIFMSGIILAYIYPISLMLITFSLGTYFIHHVSLNELSEKQVLIK